MTVRDVSGSFVFVGLTGPDGFTPPILLTTEIRGGGFTDTRNPFTFDVSARGARAWSGGGDRTASRAPSSGTGTAPGPRATA